MLITSGVNGAYRPESSTNNLYFNLDVRLVHHSTIIKSIEMFSHCTMGEDSRLTSTTTVKP